MTSLRPAAKIEKMGVIQIQRLFSIVGEEIHHLVYDVKCYLHFKRGKK